MIEQARGYWELGWSPIPLKYRSKVPNLKELAPLLEREGRMGSLAQLKGYDWQGVGIVTGQASGIVVLDADGDMGKIALKELGIDRLQTPTALTGNGYHQYFKHPGGRLATSIRFFEGLDLKADGGYVVAPPSVHPNGIVYMWAPERSPWQVPLAELPQQLMSQLRSSRATRDNVETQLVDPIADGGRNDTLTQVAGALRRRGLPPDVMYTVLQTLNEVHCQPPLPREEVARIANNIGRYPAGYQREPRVATVTTRVEFSDNPPIF